MDEEENRSAMSFFFNVVDEDFNFLTRVREWVPSSQCDQIKRPRLTTLFILMVMSHTNNATDKERRLFLFTNGNGQLLTSR